MAVPSPINRMGKKRMPDISHFDIKSCPTLVRLCDAMQVAQSHAGGGKGNPDETPGLQTSCYLREPDAPVAHG